MGVQVSKRAAEDLCASVADAISGLDIDQEVREQVAAAVIPTITENAKLRSLIDHPDTYALIATDPLVPCAGWDDDDGEHHDCRDGTKIRIGMHLRSAPDGRAASWKQRAPFGTIRCVTCGAMQFSDEYRRNVLARAES